MKKSAQEIAKFIGGEISGDASLIIEGITNLENPKPHHLTFVIDEKFLRPLEESSIACIIAPLHATSDRKTLITCQNPKLAFAKTLQLFYPVKPGSGKISSQAYISPSAKLGKEVTVEDFVCIADNAVIGDRTILGAGVYIGENAVVGSDCRLHPHVVIYDHCVIGNRVIVHGNSCVGSDGFGYVHTGTQQVKVPQVGNVVIEDDVEIGSCTTIDRATIGSTRIHRGVKIDNQVQIAHNCQIGENTALSSFVGISGSSKLGKNCIVGGQVGFGDHCEIGDNVIIGAQAGIPTGKKVKDGVVLLGSPARPIQKTKEQIAAITMLPHLIKKVAALEEAVRHFQAAMPTENSGD